ncbi:MAG: ABC transporter ATP-binding protein [Actinomyces sp.]|nr:MAG: ABC transporter ATP-binding protein [Actinomyces sp.]
MAAAGADDPGVTPPPVPTAAPVLESGAGAVGSPRTPTDAAVVLAGVSRSFAGSPALDACDLIAPRGRITVVLGPNGAGKTTAIRVVTGALAADTGRVRTLGLDPLTDGEEVRRRCGVVSAKPALYDRLSGRENLRYAADLHGLGRARRERRLVEAAGRFGIADALDHRVGGYSTGMKTRLALARAVLHDPDLCLFDEPTSGLDPESAQSVLGLIREMTDEGRTVVMCTHHLAEAEGLADHIVVLDHGRTLLAGSPGSLVRRFWPRPEVTVETEAPLDPALLARPGVEVLELAGGGTRARLALEEASATADVVAAVVAAGGRVRRVVPHEPGLEALYFAVRRHAATGAGGGPASEAATSGETP